MEAAWPGAWQDQQCPPKGPDQRLKLEQHYGILTGGRVGLPGGLLSQPMQRMRRGDLCSEKRCWDGLRKQPR